MKKISFLILISVSFLYSSCSKNEKSPSYFSFHLLSEPQDLDPAHFRGSSGNYLFHNIFRNLYKFSKTSLQPELAKKCTWKTNTQLVCQLNQKLWSDGSPITSSHYLESYRRLFDKNIRSVQSELLLNIKNAKEILANKKKPHELAIFAPQPDQLIFQLVKPDTDFLYNLTNPSLGPLHPNNNYLIKNANKLITNGPYIIQSWKKGSHILLKPNPYYDKRAHLRPMVKVFFVENDETALTLFETGKLSFLRRLPSHQIEVFKNHPGFFQTPFFRFDYIGISGDLNNYPEFKKALTLSLNYPELKRLYLSKGMPGCPGFSKKIMLREHCHPFLPQKALKKFLKVPKDVRQKPLTLYFSKLGGKDIKKGMEWVQNQWKKHLGLKVNLMSVEQGMYLNKLSEKKTTLFRKGVGLDTPTCLAALRTFRKNGHENYLGFESSQYNKILEQLAVPEQSELLQKKLCSQGLDILINSASWIPLGEIHFSMIHNLKYKGWFVNSLNQLDLTGLIKTQNL